MRHQQDLQVALRDRLRRLLIQDYGLAAHEVALVVDWMGKQSALRAILSEAERHESGLDYEEFLKQFDQGSFSWPSRTEEGRAALIWRLLTGIAEDERQGRGDQAVRNFILTFSRSSNLNDSWREFVEQAVAPLFDFLDERVGAESSILYVLERYVRRIEWFDREKLYLRFQADTRNGEEVYNLDLQRFLFLEGNYVTHAKPRSASGEADIIGELETEDPLVCDGKIFDGGSRGKSYVAKGFNQIVQYAQDHQKNAAYLVVFNVSNRLLQFPTDGPKGVFPPYIEVSGVRVYLVAIRALPPAATASKLGKASPCVMSREDFLNPDLD